MQAAPKYHLENSRCTRWYKTSNKILSCLVLAYVYVFPFPYTYDPTKILRKNKLLIKNL